MNAKDLKNSILQLAIQGKIVVQREEEGIAKDLIEKIKVEREQLIKEKKIKKEKKLPDITDDEIPFDIPKSWEWVRLVDLADTSETPFADGPFGSNLKREHYVSKPEVRIIQLSNIGENGWKNDNVKYTSFLHAETIKRSKVNNGNIVIAKMMPAGRAIEVPEVDNAYILSSDAVKFVPHKLLYKKYLLNAINSIVFRSQIYAEVQGITRVRTSLTKLKKYLIPLPPLEEQKRIVAKIEELMPYVEKYDKAYSKVEELNKKFPEDMQKSILQYAIQGKLVKQREEDGTAEELYKQIQEEKKILVKEGKVKKPKKLMEITEKDIPFDIPESWKWVRLGDIFDINPRNTVNDDTNVSFIPMALIEDGYRSEFSYETKSWGEVKKGYTHFKDGDIVMAKITPCFQNLKSAIMANLENGVGAGTTELHVLRAYSKISLEYFLWFIKSPIFVSTCVTKMTGTAGQQRVGTDTITNYVVPLPPLKEQKRIVAKIEDMLPQCKQLVK